MGWDQLPIIGALMGKGPVDRLQDVAAQKAELNLENLKQQQAARTALMKAGQDVAPVVNSPGDGMGPTATMVGNQAFASDGSTGVATMKAPSDGMGPSADMVNGEATAPTDGANAAQSYADKQNAPQAKMGRQRVIMDTLVDPAGAQGRQLNDAKLQGDQLALTKDQETHVKQLFDDSLNGLTSHKAIADLVNSSQQGDHANGSTVMAVPNKDGDKVQYRVVAPDGTVAPQGPEFTNDVQGLTNAKAFLAKNLSIGDKLSHLHQQFMLDQESKKIAISQQNANSESKLRDAQAEYYSGRNGVAAMGRSSKAALYDEKEWSPAYKIEPSFVSFQDDMGGKPVESPDLRLAYQSSLNSKRADGMYSPNQAAELAKSDVLTLKNKASELLSAIKPSGPLAQWQADEMAKKLQLTRQEAAKDLIAISNSPRPEALAVQLYLKEFRAIQQARTAQASSGQPGAAIRPAPVAAPAPAQAQMRAPTPDNGMTGDSALNAIQAGHIAVLNDLKQRVNTAQIQLAAAAKSGDPNVVNTYATMLQQARDRLTSEANRRLGNGAAAYLAR